MWCERIALGILLVGTRAVGVLGSTLPLVGDKFRPMYAVDLLEPQAVTVPGKAVIDYKVRSIGGASATGADPRMMVGISVDGRILAYQSLAQCLEIPCWLPLARYPLATISGDHALEVQVVQSGEPLTPLSHRAFHRYTVRRVDLSQKISDDFMTWWHSEARVWASVSWLGVASQKLPSDMWSYQEVISSLQPALVIETGTRIGGSALFFANVLNGLTLKSSMPAPLYSASVCGTESGTMCPSPFVLTIDLSHAAVAAAVKSHPSIELLEGSSTGSVARTRLRSLLKNPERPRNPKSRVFVILDSDHRSQHVFNELELFAEMLSPGDYVVVEDGIVNGHPVEAGWGDGPYEAIEKFEAMYGKNVFFLHDRDRENKFGVTVAPNGYLVRTLVGWNE
eukprot:g3456.t1